MNQPNPGDASPSILLYKVKASKGMFYKNGEFIGSITKFILYLDLEILYS